MPGEMGIISFIDQAEVIIHAKRNSIASMTAAGVVKRVL